MYILPCLCTSAVRDHVSGGAQETRDSSQFSFRRWLLTGCALNGTLCSHEGEAFPGI